MSAEENQTEHLDEAVAHAKRAEAVLRSMGLVQNFVNNNRYQIKLDEQSE